jgi:hypothetical protein
MKNNKNNKNTLKLKIILYYYKINIKLIKLIIQVPYSKLVIFC